MNKDYLEFINSVRKFNEVAKFEFLKRYYEYFNRNADPNHNTTYKIKINQFSDEAIKQFPSMTLQDQYDLIFEVIRNEMFYATDNCTYDLSSGRIKKLNIPQSTTEDGIMNLIPMIDEKSDYLGRNDYN